MKNKKNTLFIGISIFIIVILIGYSFKKEPGITYQNITSEVAYNELQNDSSIILLDVRTKEEHETKKIPNSKNIEVNELKDKALSEFENKKVKIFIYCQSGVRAKQASEILVSLGYEQVYNIGGIIDWPYETE